MGQLLEATLETIYMVGVSSAISFIVAMILGTILHETKPHGLMHNKIIHTILNRVIDTIRAVPFIILVIFIFPLTKIIVGTSIGTTAMIVPLTICSIPFEARLVEENLSQVSKDVVEAAEIDGATKLQIILEMKWKIAASSLVHSYGVSVINIIGYSAMSGIIGGGGLGNYAIIYGFQRYNWNIILVTVLVLIALVSITQIIINLIKRSLK